MVDCVINKFWDKEALSGKKEEVRGEYLSELFLKAIDKGLGYLPQDKHALRMLKTDLWNEGADFKKNILGNYTNNGFKLYGIDLSWEVLKAVKINTVFKAQANISKMPFADSVFDAILDLSTIDHVPQGISGSVLGEYERILRPGGMLIIAFDAWGLIWRLYFSYLKNIKGLSIGVFTGTKIVNQYIYKPCCMVKKLSFLGFDILGEYSIDWFGWSWNRLTAPFWKNLTEEGYRRLVNIEYSFISKYMKALAKQYVILARKAAADYDVK